MLVPQVLEQLVLDQRHISVEGTSHIVPHGLRQERSQLLHVFQDGLT